MDLRTKYLGLELKNPLIVGSSGLTDKVDKIKSAEANNAGAVVIKSLFEEQINAEINKTVYSGSNDYPEAYEYIQEYTRDKTITDYLNLIKDAKSAVDIPVIASINCVNDTEWTSFAKEIENAGADALELNISLLPSDPFTDAEETEKMYFKITEKVNKSISIPISLKMSYYSAGLAKLIYNLSASKNVDGITLFNRFYNPDIDINTLEIVSSNVFSTPDEYILPLRWIALLSEKIDADMAATTGIHDGISMAKQVLAGASAVHIVSILYKHGLEYIGTILKEFESVMSKHGFNNIDEMKGQLSFHNIKNNRAYERIQFMKYFGGIS
ncbi:MAG: dihydroorotate dehydrogenase-like protein [Bacteroidales bacterium]|nr:dihydroorotate dehydrogenase-like protein [Bacteroidales bacterium]